MDLDADRRQGTLAALGEDALISRLRAILAEVPLPPDWLGIGDDCAITTVEPGEACVTTTDLLVEDVHFRLTTTDARSLGWKALAVNVSDVASMGAEPAWATVSLSLPGACPVDWIEDLYRGIAEAARACGIAIVGGDTVGSPGPRTLAITAVGTTRHPLRRDAACPGDRLALTGWPGLSHAGLWVLEHPDARAGIDPEHLEVVLGAHRRPRPHLEESRLLVGLGERVACLDSSDGLRRSAGELARASGVRIEMQRAWIPLHPALVAIARVAGADPVVWALGGGEDYHLVVAASPVSLALARERGLLLHEVGSVVEGSGVWLDGSPSPVRGLHDHFAPGG